MNFLNLQRQAGPDDAAKGIPGDASSSADLFTSVASIWEQREKERGSLPRMRVWREDWNKRGKKLNFGPGGGVGVGCGAGIGFAVTGGLGVGAQPWNSLKFVFGIGAGCGVGIGYGFGHGLGVLWDRRPKKKSEKRIVFEL